VADLDRKLLQAGRTLVADLDLGGVLDRVLAAAAEITGARYVALGVLNERREGLERFVTYGLSSEGIGDPPHGRGILGVLITDPRPLRLDSVSHDPRSYGFPPGHPRMETFLGTPVLIRGEAWGNLYLTEKAGGGPFTQADEDAVVVLAEWAAIAIENARLYDATSRRRSELEAAAAIARAVGTETDLERVLELIVERGRRLLRADGVAIRLGGSVAASAGELHEPTAVPLDFKGRTLGSLEVCGSTDDDLLAAVAASAATAVAMATTVAEQRLRVSMAAAEEERRRWARELHDATLQDLGALRLLLRAGKRDPSVLDDAIGRLEESIGELRGLIRELRPAALDELGLAAALEGLAERHGVRAQVRVARYAPELETGVYRVVQEALNNAVKHAGAHAVHVTVEDVGEAVHLTVADDGRGFDPEAEHAGFGLGGMQERVALLGGELEIDSSARGTRVSAVLPTSQGRR
jgi:signal transduction histidine kinase